MSTPPTSVTSQWPNDIFTVLRRTLLPLLVSFPTDGKGEVCVLFTGQPQSSFSFIFGQDFLNVHLCVRENKHISAIASTQHFTYAEHNLWTDIYLPDRPSGCFLDLTQKHQEMSSFFSVCFHSYSFALLTNISLPFNVPLSGLSLEPSVLVYVSSTLLFHVKKLPFLLALMKQMELHKSFTPGYFPHPTAASSSTVLP